MSNDTGDHEDYKIVMIRHGEIEGNQKKHFYGWFDADLSDKGRDEAVTAGKILKAEGYEFDVAHTSALKRAQNTLNLVLHEIGQTDMPIFKTWRLNERHYGALTGLSEAETVAKYGEIQLEIWKRSFHVPSPPMAKDHPYYETIANDSRYASDPTPAALPMFESLQLTIERSLIYWNEVIIPQIQEGKRIIISAHGNSLKGIVKQLDDLTDAGIMELKIPSGIPFVYQLNSDMMPIGQVTYLGNHETVRKAMVAAAAEEKKGKM